MFMYIFPYTYEKYILNKFTAVPLWFQMPAWPGSPGDSGTVPPIEAI